jgi:Nucleotidyl transferase AbiEii toxin, Type IV TA system
MAADLAKYDRRWALVGGFAVSARAEPRFTRDIDAAVAVADDADGEGLVRLLLADGYRLLASVEQGETGRLATVRLGAAAAVRAARRAQSSRQPVTVRAAPAATSGTGHPGACSVPSGRGGAPARRRMPMHWAWPRGPWPAAG